MTDIDEQNLERVLSGELPGSRFSPEDQIIERMVAAVTPGKLELSDDEVAVLADCTAELVALRGDDAELELDRFLDVPDRSLEVPKSLLREHLAGKTILVTGGSGCVGGMLLRECTQYEPARLVSLARGEVNSAQQIDGVEYVAADVGDAEAVMRVCQSVQPDIIYHVAAARAFVPGSMPLSDYLQGSIMGALNIARAAQACGASEVVYASSLKAALASETTDAYSRTKKINEISLGLAAAESSVRFAGVRIVHVADNSVMVPRFMSQAEAGSPMRLNGASTQLNVQSAQQAAQSLIIAGMEAEAGTFSVQGVRDMGAPVRLLDIALGIFAKVPHPTPIYFYSTVSTGQELSGKALVSRVFNHHETDQVQRSVVCANLDRLRCKVDGSEEFARRLGILEKQIGSGASDDELSESLDALMMSVASS